jgi:hypothetical protein
VLFSAPEESSVVLSLYAKRCFNSHSPQASKGANFGFSACHYAGCRFSVKSPAMADVFGSRQVWLYSQRESTFFNNTFFVDYKTTLFPTG